MFGAWAVCAFSVCLGYLVATALGVVPGVIALVVLGSRRSVWPEGVGAVAGADVAAVFLGLTFIEDDPARVATRAGEPGPWIAGGVAAFVIGVLVYWLVDEARRASLAAPRRAAPPRRRRG